MKKIFNFLIILSLTFIWAGCGDDNEKDLENNEADYYVKYEANVTSPYIGNNIKYTVNIENGWQTFKSGKTFSQTFGPFKKGFHAYIIADASEWHQADCEVRIYVCRGSEPFALKANNSGGKNISASYTIDY